MNENRVSSGKFEAIQIMFQAPCWTPARGELARHLTSYVSRRFQGHSAADLAKVIVERTLPWQNGLCESARPCPAADEDLAGGFALSRLERDCAFTARFTLRPSG